MNNMLKRFFGDDYDEEDYYEEEAVYEAAEEAEEAVEV